MGYFDDSFMSDWFSSSSDADLVSEINRMGNQDLANTLESQGMTGEQIANISAGMTSDGKQSYNFESDPGIDLQAYSGIMSDLQSSNPSYAALFNQPATTQESGISSLLKSLGINLDGMSDKSKDRLASGAITAGGLLLKSIADQALSRRQIQAAKDVQAQNNQYQIDAEKRIAERAKYATTAKEDWGFSKTGLLDAAMRQQRSK